MHKSALENASRFFQVYTSAAARNTDGGSRIILEIGSKIVDGSIKGGTIRTAAPADWNYIGADFENGNGVDLILDDPYRLPFESNKIDIVVSSSCFEHSEMFWLVYLEIIRVLKPSGLFYLNAPSNGFYHRFPVDAWRFYPDSGQALVSWGRRNEYPNVLLESFVTPQQESCWNDFVAVFLKNEEFLDNFPRRIIDSYEFQFFNGKKFGTETMLNYSFISEDQMKLEIIEKIANNSVKLNRK
jgi:SAM-dependent methyltransferase